METPNEFDLNAHLAGWRRGLAAARLAPDEVTELESHLHDAMERLRGEGHTASEAFFSATARLGSGAELGAEFAKANTGRRPPGLLVAVATVLILGGLQAAWGFVGDTDNRSGGGVLGALLGCALLRGVAGVRLATLGLLAVATVAAALLGGYYASADLPTNPTGFWLSIMGFTVPHPGAGKEWILAAFCLFLAGLFTWMQWALLRPPVIRFFRRG